jgi:hypothetical protein
MVGLAWPLMKVLLAFVHPRLKALGMAPLITGLLYGYARTTALSKHIKQYGRMSLLFANAKQRLEELMTSGKYAGAQPSLRIWARKRWRRTATECCCTASGRWRSPRHDGGWPP